MIFIIHRDFCNMNFINVIEEMDALNIIGQKYCIKDMILFAIILSYIFDIYIYVLVNICHIYYGYYGFLYILFLRLSIEHIT